MSIRWMSKLIISKEKVLLTVGAGLGASDGALLGLCEVNWFVGIDVGFEV